VTTRAEDVLFASLTDVDALELIAKDGMPEECIPTEEMRQVVSWAVDRFFESGRLKAPSRAALEASWADVIEGAGVELLSEDEEIDNIEWALDDLRATYANYRFQTWMRTAAREMADATAPERLDVLSEQANELHQLVIGLQTKVNQAEGIVGFQSSLDGYRRRQEAGTAMLGMTFGLGAIDQHTYGIHPGELAVILGPQKMGKSFFATMVGLQEWTHQRRVILFTLENSVEMTYDRMVCQQLGIDSRRYQRGLCGNEEIERIGDWISDHGQELRDGIHVIMAPMGMRTVPAMIRQAQMLGGDSVIIDQLTFVDHPDPGRKSKPERIGENLHELKSMISTGRHRLSCLMPHQLNREGIKQAEKDNGKLAAWMAAEASEVERTADWMFGLYQSSDQRMMEQATLQILAARRENLAAWELAWRPSSGLVSVIGEAEA
jgi:hypothetical protein